MKIEQDSSRVLSGAFQIRLERFRVMLVELGQGQATPGPNRVHVIQRVGFNTYDFAVPWSMLRLIFIARKSY